LCRCKCYGLWNRDFTLYQVTLYTEIYVCISYTKCGRNNSHISKNHCGVSKAGSGVWSIPLGRVHKVFGCSHAVVGWASRLCSGGFFLKKFPPFGHSEQTKFSLLGCWKPSRTPCTTSSQPKSDRLVYSVAYRRHWALLFLKRVESQLLWMPIDTATCRRNFCSRKLTSMGKNTTWFQQDGATAHTARHPRAILKMFPGRVVSLHEAIPWPPRSPDLSPCDFFLRGTSRPRFSNIVPGPWTN
jgi:hypothetical protein